jgi:hypothetical protein
MSDIEELVRESLQSAPTPQPRTTDPVAAVSRRVARARMRLALGAAAAVVATVAAVVVPVQLTGSGHARVDVGRSPAPGPSSRDDIPTVWWPHGNVSLAAGGGALWHLRTEVLADHEQRYVDKLDPVTHARLGEWEVDNPAAFLAYGLDRVWVWGGGGGADPDGLLQVVDPAGGPGGSLTNRGHAFNGIAFAGERAWVTTGSAVWQVDTSLVHVASVVLDAPTTQHGIVTTQSGEMWVQTGDRWVRVDPGQRTVLDRVTWSGPMLGAAGGGQIWTYDGSRLVTVEPALLHQGQSVAVGERIAVPGPVTSVTGTVASGLFVAALDKAGPDGGTRLYYLAPGTATTTGDLAHVPSVAADPRGAVPDGRGGVNYSDGDAAMHWTP